MKQEAWTSRMCASGLLSRKWSWLRRWWKHCWRWLHCMCHYAAQFAVWRPHWTSVTLNVKTVATASLRLFNTSVVTKKKKKNCTLFHLVWTSEQVFMLSLLLDWFTYWAIYLIVYFLLQGVQNWGGITERLWISKPKCYLAMIHIHWMHWLMLHINCFHVFGLFLCSTEYHFPENLSSLLAVLIISVYLLK